TGDGIARVEGMPSTMALELLEFHGRLLGLAPNLDIRELRCRGRDGIARVEGMPSTMALELLEFPGGLLGMALNLDIREIGCVVFGDASGIEEGDEVKHTGRVLSVPVGDAFLGRGVGPLGRPLDGHGDIEAEATRALELQAPTVVQRQPVKEPLETGIKAIDAMTNIGRGQRELVIGDQKTGKSAVCLDTIINQRQHWGTDK